MRNESATERCNLFHEGRCRYQAKIYVSVHPSHLSDSNVISWDPRETCPLAVDQPKDNEFSAALQEEFTELVREQVAARNNAPPELRLGPFIMTRRFADDHDNFNGGGPKTFLNYRGAEIFPSHVPTADGISETANTGTDNDPTADGNSEKANTGTDNDSKTPDADNNTNEGGPFDDLWVFMTDSFNKHHRRNN